MWAQARSDSPLSIEFVAHESSLTYSPALAVAPDGTALAYDVCHYLPSSPNRVCEIYVKPLPDGQPEKVVTLGSALGMRWSPNSRAIAFFAGSEDGSERLWVWDRATGQSRQLNTFVAKNPWIGSTHPVIW